MAISYVDVNSVKRSLHSTVTVHSTIKIIRHANNRCARLCMKRMNHAIILMISTKTVVQTAAQCKDYRPPYPTAELGCNLRIYKLQPKSAGVFRFSYQAISEMSHGVVYLTNQKQT